MTDEQMRIRLAELVGWTGYFPQSTLPNYPADLNACHEIERGLTDEQFADYERNLRQVTLRDGRDGGGLCERLILATARQRTEALIRTLEGKVPL